MKRPSILLKNSVTNTAQTINPPPPPPPPPHSHALSHSDLDHSTTVSESVPTTYNEAVRNQRFKSAMKS
ncbi:unnamed protein product [Brassica oleracea var. botrytis]